MDAFFAEGLTNWSLLGFNLFAPTGLLFPVVLLIVLHNLPGWENVSTLCTRNFSWKSETASKLEAKCINYRKGRRKKKR